MNIVAIYAQASLKLSFQKKCHKTTVLSVVVYIHFFKHAFKLESALV